jgi:TM2 domain-containing membrane protein YozV
MIDRANIRNRTIAAVLAFFGGFAGIHKFYLGENVAGFMYMLFSWTMIPGIIAFFEFLGLLFMSDRAFDLKFNSHYPGYLPTAVNSSIRRSPKEITSTLMELKKLYDAGVITAEEYEQKRRKFLDFL